MTDLIWDIKLKLNSMLTELKWYLKLYKQNMQGTKEFLVLFPKMLSIYFLALTIDSIKTLFFLKSMIQKRVIFIPLMFMFLIFFYYIFLIAGEPDKKLFKEKIFPKFYYATAIEIRDQEGRLAGSIAQPESFHQHPSLFLEKTPDFFWSLLKEQYDEYFTFDNNATTLYEAFSYSPPYLNGINLMTPFIESKELLLQAVLEQKLSFKSQPTLTQQLVNNYVHRYMKTPINNQERLKLCKTFYHQLKEENGENFQRWLLSEHALFYAEGKGYGLKDTAEIFFGKKVKDLTEIEQIVLLAMYKKPYKIDSSLALQKKQWGRLKNIAINIVNNSKIVENQPQMVSNIRKLAQPKIPYFPDSLMEVVGKITDHNQELFSTLPNRSHALLGNTKEVLSQELNGFFKQYGVNSQNRLITKVNINFHLDQNFYFNRHLSNLFQESKLNNIWISIVNEKGEFVNIFQQESNYKSPPQIGNLSKILTSLLFVDRGDKYYTKYCNKALPQQPKLGGYEKCPSHAWVDARKLFASDQILPLYDGFTKYKVADKQSNKSHYKPIYMKQIEKLYLNLNLQMLENNEPKEDLGLGKLQMSPLDFQVTLHKITQLLYNPKEENFYEAKLINSIEYHKINNAHIESEAKIFSLESPSAISPSFKNFFKKEQRIQLQTIFKAPIYKPYGTLYWLKNYATVKFLFAQESHREDSHWLVGAFKKSGHYYNFVLYTQDNKLSKNQRDKEIQKLLESAIKALNYPEKMRNNYMKMLYGD